jgi:acetyl esterase/lipase
MYIVCGDDEILRDDSINLAERARKDGVEVHIDVVPHHFHVFNYFHKVLSSAKLSNKTLAEFIKKHTTKS